MAQYVKPRHATEWPSHSMAQHVNTSHSTKRHDKQEKDTVRQATAQNSTERHGYTKTCRTTHQDGTAKPSHRTAQLTKPRHTMV